MVSDMASKLPMRNTHTKATLILTFSLREKELTLL
jgi:hypothetical protein